MKPYHICEIIKKPKATICKVPMVPTEERTIGCPGKLTSWLRLVPCTTFNFPAFYLCRQNQLNLKFLKTNGFNSIYVSLYLSLS